MLFLALGSPRRMRVCCVALPAALQNPQKKHAPGLLEHIPYGFYLFVLIVVRFSYLFAGFRVSQQRACVLRYLRRFRTLRTNTPLNFGGCTLWFLLMFVDCCLISLFVLRFSGLPAGCVFVALPAAPENPQKKYAPGIWEHVPYRFY